jgi:hypothetical protein
LGRDADAVEVLFEEMRARYGDAYESNLATAHQEANWLWRPDVPADEAIFQRLLSHPVATHPDMFELMRKAGEDRVRIGTAPTAGTEPLTRQQEKALVIQTATHYFGKLQGNRLFEDFIQAIGTDEAAWRWAVSVGRRLWGR